MNIRFYIFAFLQKSIHKWMGWNVVLSKPLWLNLLLIIFALLSFGSWKIFNLCGKKLNFKPYTLKRKKLLRYTVNKFTNCKINQSTAHSQKTMLIII